MKNQYLWDHMPSPVLYAAANVRDRIWLKRIQKKRVMKRSLYVNGVDRVSGRKDSSLSADGLFVRVLHRRVGRRSWTDAPRSPSRNWLAVHGYEEMPF